MPTFTQLPPEPEVYVIIFIVIFAAVAPPVVGHLFIKLVRSVFSIGNQEGSTQAGVIQRVSFIKSLFIGWLLFIPLIYWAYQP